MMQFKNQMEDLCKPIILYVCNLWILKNKGYETNEEVVINDINLHLSKIKEKLTSDPILYKEFLTIEKSLIFFIDHIIKEGNFSFSKSWKILSKKYGELSGDDKFFNILESILLDPTAKERVELLYLMMGLGFDGGYRDDQEQIESIMRNCTATMPKGLDVNSNFITPYKHTQKETKKRYSKGKILLISYASVFVLLVLTLTYNYSVFKKEISPVNNAIEQAINSATQNFDVYSFDNKNQIENQRRGNNN